MKTAHDQLADTLTLSRFDIESADTTTLATTPAITLHRIGGMVAHVSVADVSTLSLAAYQALPERADIPADLDETIVQWLAVNGAP